MSGQVTVIVVDVPGVPLTKLESFPSADVYLVITNRPQSYVHPKAVHATPPDGATVKNASWAAIYLVTTEYLAWSPLPPAVWSADHIAAARAAGGPYVGSLNQVPHTCVLRTVDLRAAGLGLFDSKDKFQDFLTRHHVVVGNADPTPPPGPPGPPAPVLSPT